MSITPGTLRAELEARRASSRSFSLAEALSIIVPLCSEIQQIHGDGKLLFVHPSAILFTGSAASLLEDKAEVLPTLPADIACVAPEARSGSPGDARASVFSVGAILYEMLTGGSVGPGMRRPSEAVAGLPPHFEMVLGKALVAMADSRPADLGALAQALQDMTPAARPKLESIAVELDFGSLPPPPVAGANVVATAVPPAPRAPQLSSPFPIAVVKAPQVRSDNPTQRLADLKARLESDPSPRYVVIKDGMDHGPFNAVEMLQQIATNTFVGENILRDTAVNDEKFIKDWEQFAPFAEQAKLNRDIKQEKKALEEVVVKERQGTQYKALIGAAVVGVLVAGFAGWLVSKRGSRKENTVVQGDKVVTVDVDGGLSGSNKSGGPNAGGGSFNSGGRPVLAGGMSCEGAQAKYVEDYSKDAPPDLTAGAYGNVLNRGTYLNACGVPPSTEVNICAAVQNGRAVGVTVTTRPSNPGVNSCVAGAVRGLSFPAHPRLDVSRTTFAPQ
ncbi:MAG: hypothetical protein IPM54_26735 [Polyangiaceae bacterium]|nr:hypothetical protein [Polyangiaceae bacterium]